MYLNLDDVAEGGLDIEASLPLPELRGEGERPLVREPARLSGRAELGVRGVDLEGVVRAVTILDCSRCLEPFDWPVEARFRLTLVPRAEVDEAAEAGEHEMQGDDAMLFHAPDGRAGLEEIAGEQILLNLPLKPVCSTDCRGLCPACGANRNDLECDCRGGEVDPRLAGLQQLKNRLGGSDTS